MDKLYVEIEIFTQNDETEIYTTVPSFMAIYVYRYLCQNPKALISNLKLCFVRSKKPITEGKLKLNTDSLRQELEERIILKEAATAETEAIKDLRLPVYEKDTNTFIAGMCAVCRELISRHAIDDSQRSLLGFKESCLLAPAEASIWTRFCEVDVIKTVSRLLYQKEKGIEILEVPLEVSRFERHMNEPVRMHNIYKLAREKANSMENSNGTKTKNKKKGKVIIECSIPKEKLEIDHTFAEGISFTIADLILYPCMRLIFQHCAGMLRYFPLTNTWLSEVCF